MELIKRTYTISEVQRMYTAVESLKLCPALSMKISIALNRLGRRMKKLVESYVEDTQLIREKAVAQKKEITGEEDETKLVFSPEELVVLNGEIDKLTKEPLEVEVPELSSKEFPTDSSKFGMRRHLRSETTTGRIFEAETYFYDHYLALLGDLIADDYD